MKKHLVINLKKNKKTHHCIVVLIGILIPPDASNYISQI